MCLKIWLGYFFHDNNIKGKIFTYLTPYPYFETPVLVYGGYSPFST